MEKIVKLPDWHPQPIYKKDDLTPEEWLQEIYKRVILKEKLERPSLSKTEQEEIFSSIILKNEVEDVLAAIRPILPRPFRPLSLTELLIMAFQVFNSKWYKTLKEKNELETALGVFVNQGLTTLTPEQKELLYICKEIPWYEFRGEEPKTKWLPEEHPFLHGIPISFNPGFHREDSLSELRSLINAWQKPKTRPLSKKIFKDWQSKRILELFDLNLWFKIQETPLRPMELAKTLWPESLPSKRIKDSNARLIDLLKEAQRISKKAIQKSSLQTLFAACESRAAQRHCRK